MRFYKSPLTIICIFLFAIGIILNIRMFVIEAWPTYLFFTLMAVALLFIFIDMKIRGSENILYQNKIIIQSIISSVLLAFTLFVI